jgi:TonB family protein
VEKVSSRAGRATPWAVVVVAAAVVLGSIYWIAWRPARPQASQAPRATQAPSMTDSGARLLADVERAIDESRFVDAIIALQSARHAGVAEERIASLDARVRSILEQKLLAAPVPPAEEALATMSEKPAPGTPNVPQSAVVSESETAAPRRVLPAEAPAAVISRISEPVALREEQALPVPQPVDNSVLAKPRDPAPVVEPAVPSVAERKVVRMVKPEYPSEARLRGIEGWADLSFTVSSAGAVIDPRVEDSSMRQLFARPALAAVKQWKYESASAALAPERIKVRVEFRTHD